MNKIKKSTIVWLVLLVALVAFIIYIGVRLYTIKEEQSTELPDIIYGDGETGTLSIENDQLKLDIDKATSQFKLTEKATGRVWLSNPENAASDPVAKSSQANLYALQSTLLLTYTDRDKGTANITYNNYQRSIANNNYVFKDITDTSVAVEYAIGDINRVYMMPYAITEERFTMYTDKMKTELGMSKSKVNSKVSNLYSIISPDTLAKMSAAEREKNLAMYPSAAEQAIRVLDTSKKADYQSVSDYFVQVGYNQEEFDLDQQLIAGTATVEKPIFNITVRYKLEGGDFVVEVPYEEIRYRANFPITTLTVLPMFGAAGTADTGYMFVPEGGGAIINFNNQKLTQNAYYANMYGWDYATFRSEVVNETKNAFPVFGMAKNGGSFICVIENGSVYGGIQADISMRYNSYNWVCARYTVLHGDQYNVSDKTGTLVYMFEKQIPADTITQRYRFVDSGSYVEMARAYGQYLREKYPELTVAEDNATPPVNIELLGAIDKKVVKLGVPVNSTVPTTTFAQGESIIADLLDSGTKNLSVRFSGWMNGGVSQKVLTGVSILNELGGRGGMDRLISAARSKNVPLYFDGISCFAYRSGLFQGFLEQRDAARYTTRERVVIYPYSEVTYKSSDWLEPFYLVTPVYANRSAANLIKALKDRNAYGVAFRDIGTLLSGDYNVNDLVTREQVRKMNVETLKSAHEAGQAVMIKEGYDYAVPYADIVTDMDLNGTEYSLLDRSVPFYQIALHSKVSYTGKPINLANDWRTELLLCAEYGAGLNFSFMAEKADILQDTTYSGYFGANYDAWKDNAKAIISEYQTQMAGLNLQPIVGHEALTSDVHVTTYENGTRVYVNYGTDDYQVDGVTVPSRDYVVRGDH